MISLLKRLFGRKKKSRGRFDWELCDPDGTVVARGSVPNGSTTAGQNDQLNVYFGAGTQKTTWYIGLIDNVGFSSLSTGDTMSLHSGWNENTAYSEGTRQQWVPSAASGGTMTSSGTSNFTINASGQTFYGFFVCSDSTKGGTAGLLWATAAFTGGVQSPPNGQVFKVTYTTLET